MRVAELPPKVWNRKLATHEEILLNEKQVAEMFRVAMWHLYWAGLQKTFSVKLRFVFV